VTANVNGMQAMRESPHEKRLVARFQAGEPEALSSLFDLHVDRVYAYARHLLNNREDAEEITSEAFLRAFERAASYRAECPFRGWLFGIARNLCLDRLRQPRLILLDPEESDRAGDGCREVDRLDTTIAVRRALSELSPDYRLVLTLCDVEQWDAAEVAFMLEKTVQATKSLLYRARRALRTRLADVWNEDEAAGSEGGVRNA
jgi:RNA polymerase sigma-70 factor (ECF subfamily)